MLTKLNPAILKLQYIPVINSLRGLASVTVCLFHLICLPLNFLQHTFIFEIAPYGRFGVQIFFVITGIVIPIALIKGRYTYRLFGRFMRKRVLRIEPPYLFAILTGIIFILLRNYFLAKTPYPIPTIKSLLLHIGYLIPFLKGQKWFIIVFWTMAVEFQYYLLISLLFPLLIARKFVVRILSYCIVFALALSYRNTEFALVWLPVFMIGVIYASFIYKKINLSEFWTVLIVSIGFSFFLHGFIISFISAGTLAIIHYFSTYESKTGNFFGRISYSLYLVHTVFGTAVTNLFVPYVSGFFAKVLVVVLSFVVSLVTAYVFYLIIEKPFQKIASKISLRRKTAEQKI
ncbi:MAG: acyltransferase, partial [Sphingobacteriaceae bacterium]